MSNLTSVTVTAGVPTAGTGTVSTLDNLIGVAGTPSAQVQSVQGVAGGTALPVSAASLPLPTGAATQTTLAAVALETGGNLAAAAGGIGAAADAVVAAGAAGSLSAKLRAISRDIVANIVLAAGANVIGAVTQSGAWVLSAGAALIGIVKIGDGTNSAAIKAASTAPLATDPALVVGISPNSAGIISTGTQAAPSAAYLSTVAAGDVAAAASDSGNPVKIGGVARSSEPTALTTGQRAQVYTDLVGKLVFLPYANPENFVSGAISAAMTGTTSTSLVAAPAAGLRNYITQITVSNSHATVGTDILIQDGSGGTTLYVIPAAAVFGGATITFPTPLRQPTTATALFCANVTTGSNTKVSASGYKGV